MSLKNLRSSKQPNLTAISLSTSMESSDKYLCNTWRKKRGEGEGKEEVGQKGRRKWEDEEGRRRERGKGSGTEGDEGRLTEGDEEGGGRGRGRKRWDKGGRDRVGRREGGGTKGKERRRNESVRYKRKKRGREYCCILLYPPFTTHLVIEVLEGNGVHLTDVLRSLWQDSYLKQELPF